MSCPPSAKSMIGSSRGSTWMLPICWWKKSSFQFGFRLLDSMAISLANLTKHDIQRRQMNSPLSICSRQHIYGDGSSVFCAHSCWTTSDERTCRWNPVSRISSPVDITNLKVSKAANIRSTFVLANTATPFPHPLSNPEILTPLYVRWPITFSSTYQSSSHSQLSDGNLKSSLGW